MDIQDVIVQDRKASKISAHLRILLGSLSLYACDLQLLQLPPDVKQVAKVLEAVAAGFMEPDVASALLRCTSERLSMLCSLKDGALYKRELRQQVLVLCGGRVESGKISAPPSRRQRKAKVSLAALTLLEHMEGSIEDLALEPPHEAMRSLESLLPLPDDASARGPLTRSEYFHGKKGPQIAWFLSTLQRLRSSKDFKHVLDVGGGRGDLALQVAAEFKVKVTVVEMSEACFVGQAAARELGLNVNFCNVDFAEIKELASDIDMLVALHACGGLSDAALDFAYSRQIPFIICPCCHLKHLHLEPTGGWSSLCELESRSFVSKEIPEEQDTESSETSQVLRKLAELDRRDISWRALRVIAALRMKSMKQKYPLKRLECALATFSQDHSCRRGAALAERSVCFVLPQACWSSRDTLKSWFAE